MQTRAQRAAYVRAHCDKGLGDDCACAKMIEDGVFGENDDNLFADNADLIDRNRHTIYIEGGFGLMQLLGLGMILHLSEGDDRDIYGILDLTPGSHNSFDSIEDAVVISEILPDFKPIPSWQTEGAHITKFGRGAKSGKRAEGCGGSKHFKGGN